MPNPDFSELKSDRKGRARKPPAQGRRGSTTAPMPEKLPGWGGLPGKAQPKNRSGGVKKARIHPQSEGL